MKTKDEELKDARNEDPITGEPGSHPVGVGVGTAAGAAAGGAMGAIGGPVGAAVGAVVGGIAGAIAGKAGGEAVNPTVEDAYWREHHGEQAFVDADSDLTYEDYAPAYRVGYSGPARHRTDFDSADSALRSDWEAQKGASKLNWERAKHAARAGWHRVESRLPGDADKDGI
ncbi:hypothetical protein OKA05_27925 [Luteolibacter arcticus]|uniref:Glycine zipper domain-containing protein n=1 Tax=Luteolibacter arcticus TaxID=1581411 RepID=A0ABT3GSA3_9BACT|nr:hypothetical protein [Luteolibacter arcticus]MCW1926412.1 hypothetical protein [Luteolibacter arcticus]